MEMWHTYRSRVGQLFVILGVLALACSFLLIGSWAWLIRMAAAVLIVSGAEWLPQSQRWLETHKQERVAIGAALGVALVWMLAKYSGV